MRVLDRYLLRNFFAPFLICCLGFVAIWLVFDLSDNGGEFIEAGVGFGQVVAFYLEQLPDFAVISLPVGLLLSCLYSIGRMSRSNEIISMLTAGVSLKRILLPLLLVGLLVTGISTALNYHLAPYAQANKKRTLELLSTGREPGDRLSGHLFRNRAANRTWFAERVRLDRNQLHWVQIVQQDDADNILFKYYIRVAEYRPETKDWDFDKGSLVQYDKNGNVTSNEFLRGETVISGWDETPWRIASSTMEADLLTVPQLREYLAFNADFPDTMLAPFRTHLLYRWALPWTCAVVVLLAAPLGVVYSRRGVLAGVAFSIFIFFGMIFLTNLFLALGAGSRIAPFWAAWTPNLIFGGIGLFLLWLRNTNRDLISFAPNNPFRRHPAKS